MGGAQGAAHRAGEAMNSTYPVLFVNLAAGWGGGEQWHFAQSLALSKRGWPVELLVRPGSQLESRARAEGLPCFSISLRAASLLNPFKALRLWRELKRLKPGAVIANGNRELRAAGVLARLSGVPRVVLRRGIPQPAADWVGRLTLRLVPTRLIANSQATLDAMAAEFPDRLIGLRPRVIYNGVDPSGFSPPAQRSNTRRIAAVGRLEWEKGHDLAIRAFAVVLRHVPGARLRIVGDGSERLALEGLADRLGVRGNVEFSGASRRVAELLRDCDAFVLPSRWEGFGFAMVEAMLMELPVVACSGTSADEVVVNGVTGLLIPAEDVEAMAAALVALLEQPARARDLGRAGRLRALSVFSIDRATAELERVLFES